MSLVEKALKKVQAQAQLAAAAAPPAAAPAATLARAAVTPTTETSRERLREAPAVVPAQPDKIVRINTSALRAAGMLAPEHESRVIGGQFRQIKRPLIQNTLTRKTAGDVRNIMVGSAYPGEGKTFTAVNLALSLALEKDVSVVLVDADILKPQVSKVLHIENEPGLTDLLSDASLDVESLVLPTDVPNLSVLPAGRAVDTATELLASSRMEQVAARLGATQQGQGPRIVVYDSSPLLLTSESRALAAVTGQIVLVVRAGVTPQSSVVDALNQLGEDRYVGVVLNQSNYTEEGQYAYGRQPYGEGGEPLATDN
jgi:exopolysaccharide/PEP-CTERM locus tyrosine autokinase